MDAITIGKASEGSAVALPLKSNAPGGTEMSIERKVAGRIADQKSIAKVPAADNDRIAAYQAEYRAANKDRIRAQKAAYRSANKDRIAAYQAEYRRANKDRIAIQNSEYYRANRARILAKKAEYRAEVKNAKAYSELQIQLIQLRKELMK
jgi:hypothetical protein